MLDRSTDTYSADRSTSPFQTHPTVLFIYEGEAELSMHTFVVDS